MNQQRTSGFTLIELLVVVAIIGTLASLLLPAIGQVVQAARSLKCLSHQRQILMAVPVYADEHEGLMPLSRVFNPITGGFSSAAYKNEYLGQYLYDRDSGGQNTDNAMFTCPSEQRITKTSPTIGLNTTFCHESTAVPRDVMMASIADHSRTAITCDTNGDERWTPGFGICPADNSVPAWGTNTDPRATKARHRRGENIGFLDGHVRFSPDVLIENGLQLLILW